jgi:hypothetical protein
VAARECEYNCPQLSTSLILDRRKWLEEDLGCSSLLLLGTLITGLISIRRRRSSPFMCGHRDRCQWGGIAGFAWCARARAGYRFAGIGRARSATCYVHRLRQLILRIMQTALIKRVVSRHGHCKSRFRSVLHTNPLRGVGKKDSN